MIHVVFFLFAPISFIIFQRILNNFLASEHTTQYCVNILFFSLDFGERTYVSMTALSMLLLLLLSFAFLCSICCQLFCAVLTHPHTRYYVFVERMQSNHQTESQSFCILMSLHNINKLKIELNRLRKQCVRVRCAARMCCCFSIECAEQNKYKYKCVHLNVLLKVYIRREREREREQKAHQFHLSTQLKRTRSKIINNKLFMIFSI